MVEKLTEADDTSIVDLSFDEGGGIEVSKTHKSTEKKYWKFLQSTYVLLPTSRATPP